MSVIMSDVLIMFSRSLIMSVPADGRRATGLPRPGIAATGSFNCAGSVVVNPSLMKMIDLRPSRSPPSLTAAAFNAPIVTWFRTRSTVAAG